MSVFAWANGLASAGQVPEGSYGLALAVHARLPEGRVVDKLNAKAEDERLIEEKAEARRKYEAEYKARLAEIRKQVRKERQRLASQAYRDRARGVGATTEHGDALGQA